MGAGTPNDGTGMSPEQRIANIEEYIASQRIVAGLPYLIKLEDDRFTITFGKASKRQLITLNRTFMQDGMMHIYAKAKEVLLVDPAKKKRRK
jgi:hypothetical protein